MARRKQDYQSIRSEGGLLPADLLVRIIDSNSGLGGLEPVEYGLAKSEKLNEVITQSWTRLRKHWEDFQEAAAHLLADESGTGLTNEKWSLPLLRELGFGALPTTAGPEIGGRTYPISRFLGPIPIHLVGCGLSLDRRARGQRGAASVNPHGLVQEYLNRSDDHLWAIVSNGLQFRILRDNQALSRQSFLEFDLESMFDGEIFSDFVLLWLVAHVTRFLPPEGQRPEACWLEKWTREAEQQGTRALGDLRNGVEKALGILGQGFTSHPRNTDLREQLRSGDFSLSDFHGQLLRIVYRLIFLFVAEDRSLDGQALLHPPDESGVGALARERYAKYYSGQRLRDMASQIKGNRHADLWRQFHLVVNALSGSSEYDEIRQQLALPALGSFLWDPHSTPHLAVAELSNYDLLEALRHLAFTRQGKVLRPVDYKNLGAEELGGVYEGLLALTPQVSGDGARFSFAEFAGNERKTSGSYYTPDSLVQCLLDSALDPVVEQAIEGKKGDEAEQAILALKVCDPAVGSGHFLVGAAHRLARHLARVRANAEGESEPSPLLYQHALRDVIGRCLYGVDINPMAAELCRVSLWLEALEPGRPLSFLDHHIRVGNALLGATPELIAGGLPDDTFKQIEGDDKKACAALKKRNKEEREGGQLGLDLPMVAEPRAEYDALASGIQAIDKATDESLDAIKQKSDQFYRLLVSPEYRHQQQVADAWCAAFVWPKATIAPGAITTDTIRRLEENADVLNAVQGDVLQRVVNQYQFFHWHLAFPEVFARGGFDLILANPPWEHVELKEKEWFEAHGREDIANAQTGAIRKRLIEQLQADDPAVHRAFLDDVRKAEGESHLLRNSRRYPHCGRGRVNLYAVFAEGMRSLLNPGGRMGVVLPSGIATDDTTKFFFQDVVEKNSLRSLFSFENEEFLFPGIHHATRFCLFTAGGRDDFQSQVAQFVFFARQVEHLLEADRVFTLSPMEIGLLNPNTRTCSIFRSGRDADLTKAIYRRVPVLIRMARNDQPAENPWGISFKQGLFNMTSDSHLFRTREQLEADGWILHGNRFRKVNDEYLPLYEAKMIHHFDHRWGTYDGQTEAQAKQGKLPELDNVMHGDAHLMTMSRYWVPHTQVRSQLPDNKTRDWLIGFRDITGSTVLRTVIATIIPAVGVGHTAPLIFPKVVSPPAMADFAASLCSFVLDFTARQKIGGTHLTYGYFNQLPVLPPPTYARACLWSQNQGALCDWFLPRVLELTYTAWDLEAFGQDCGWSGPPFRWVEERRFLLRCELDAAFFHLYLHADAQGEWILASKSDGCPNDEMPEELAELKRHFPTPRDAVVYIMDTFPIVRRKDEKKYNGDYRTKHVILEIYDEMQEAIRTGQLYLTRLDPPPGPPVGPDGEFLSYEQIADDPPLHIHLPRDAALSGKVI